MTELYCGNNRKDPRLVNGGAVIGTPYQCFRKGVGLGLSLPLSTTEYEPIDNVRIWCGNGTRPDGYDQDGDRTRCLMKGVGVGKGIKSKNSNVKVEMSDSAVDSDNNDKKRYVLISSIVTIAISVTMFVVLYVWRPSNVTERDPDGTQRINWTNFLTLWGGSTAVIVFCVVFGFLLFYYRPYIN